MFYKDILALPADSVDKNIMGIYMEAHMVERTRAAHNSKKGNVEVTLDTIYGTGKKGSPSDPVRAFKMWGGKIMCVLSRCFC